MTRWLIYLMRVLLGLTAFAAAGAAAAAGSRGSTIIDTFTVIPSAELRPGSRMDLILEGTPGGRASVRITGVSRAINLSEVRAGLYRGGYTIGPADRISPSAPITARLAARGSAAVASLVLHSAPPVPIAQRPRTPAPPPVVDAAPASTGAVGRLAVAQDTAPMTVAGTVAASDEPKGALETAGVPIEVTSHVGHTRITAGATEVRGRTVPDAQVDVTVVQTGALVPGLFGVHEELLKETVRADANGDFAFRFEPQNDLRESRFDIQLRARTERAVGRSVQLVLFKQQDIQPAK